MQHILDAILAEGTSAEDFANLELPESYRAATVRKDEVDMFEGLESRDKDPRKSLHLDEVPVPDVTSCCFGGPGLDQLFVTTAISHMSVRPQPHEGGLFVCQVPVTGRLPYPFGG